MNHIDNSYSRLALIYDELADDFDYDEWFNYLDSFLKQSGVKNVIEAGCGTGNLTFRMIEKGYRVFPFDISEEMLREAQQKARRAGIKQMFIMQDMREMNFENKDAVICACDGVNYLNGDSELEGFFSSAYRSIKKEGILLFDISSEYKLKNILGNNFYFDDRDDVSLFWQNSLGINSVALSLSIFRKKESNIYERFDEEQTQYWHNTEHIAELLERCGFSEIRYYEFGTILEPNEQTERIQFVAKK